MCYCVNSFQLIKYVASFTFTKYLTAFKAVIKDFQLFEIISEIIKNSLKQYEQFGHI